CGRLAGVREAVVGEGDAGIRVERGGGEQATQVRAGRDLDLVDDVPVSGVEDVVEAALLAGADHRFAAGGLVDVRRIPEIEVRLCRLEPGVPVVLRGALVDPHDVAVPRVEGDHGVARVRGRVAVVVARAGVDELKLGIVGGGGPDGGARRAVGLLGV